MNVEENVDVNCHCEANDFEVWTYNATVIIQYYPVYIMSFQVSTLLYSPTWCIQPLGLLL